jgi:predicted kinase
MFGRADMHKLMTLSKRYEITLQLVRLSLPSWSSHFYRVVNSDIQDTSLKARSFP